jgi:hypothetical protein
MAAAVSEQFVSDAGDEGLSWEAKGNSRAPHPDSIRKVLCRTVRLWPPGRSPEARGISPVSVPAGAPRRLKPRSVHHRIRGGVPARLRPDAAGHRPGAFSHRRGLRGRTCRHIGVAPAAPCGAGWRAHAARADVSAARARRRGRAAPAARTNPSKTASGPDFLHRFLKSGRALRYRPLRSPVDPVRRHAGSRHARRNIQLCVGNQRRGPGHRDYFHGERRRSRVPVDP